MFFVGVIDISLSSTHVNFFPLASVMTIAIVLDHHFLILVPKFDTTLIVHVFRNELFVFTVLLENDVVAFTVLVVGVVTGFVGAGTVVLAIGAVVATIVLSAGFATSGVGGSATITLFVLFFIILLLMILLVARFNAVGIVPSNSINAIGSTVLANNVSLQSHFSTTS
jgi:hypothetical protein